VIFDASDNFGDAVIGTIGVNGDKITASNNATVFLSNSFSGARWGVWFANGIRQLVNNEELFADKAWASVMPTLSTGDFSVSLDLPSAAVVNLEVVDLMGRQLYAEQFRSAAGLQQRDLKLDVPAGAYVLRLRSEGRLFSQRVVVAK
jgi:hypothetical protein